MTLDKIFKVGLLALLSAFLYGVWGMKDNGRYVYHPSPDHQEAHIIDSRTGKLFFFDADGLKGTVEVRPQTGQVIMHDASFEVEKMTSPQLLILISIAICAIAGTLVYARRRKRRIAQEAIEPQAAAGKSEPQPTQPPLAEPPDEFLRQRLRVIVAHDEAKVDRLIEFERAELQRKGQPEESVNNLMFKAIERWGRENRSIWKKRTWNFS